MNFVSYFFHNLTYNIRDIMNRKGSDNINHQFTLKTAQQQAFL